MYIWNWSFFLDKAEDGRTYLEWLCAGVIGTFIYSFLAFFIAVMLGTLVGVMLYKKQQKVTHFIAVSFIHIFRNVPLIIQLFMWYFVFPELLPVKYGDYIKLNVPTPVIGVIGLALYTSPRIAEQVRAGIASLRPGLKSASLALGLSVWQSYYHVILPLAFRVILPTLTSELMNIVKNSSVLFSIGVVELYFQYRYMIDITAHPFEVTIIITGLYMAIAFLCSRFMNRLSIRYRVPGIG